MNTDHAQAFAAARGTSKKLVASLHRLTTAAISAEKAMNVLTYREEFDLLKKRMEQGDRR